MQEHDDTAAIAEALLESAQANVLPAGDAAALLDQPSPHGAEPDGHATRPSAALIDDELEEAIEEAG